MLLGEGHLNINLGSNFLRWKEFKMLRSLFIGMNLCRFPLTHRPHGLTVCSTTALQYNASAGDGDMDCKDLFTLGTASVGAILAGSGTIDGTLTIGTVSLGVQGSAGSGFVGQRAYISGTFTSAASTVYHAVPFAGNLIGAITVADTTPRTCAGFTVRNGSAGSVAVATVALTFATASGQQVNPTITPITVTTASGISVVVITAGTACNFGYTLIIEKTA